VTAEELHRLAELLRRPLDYFFNPVRPRTVFALRADNDEASGPVREALVALDNRLADLRRLEVFSGISVRAAVGRYQLAEWRRVDYAATHVARDERRRLELGTRPVNSLRETLENKIGLMAFGMYVPRGGFSGAFAFDGERAAMLVNLAHFAGRVNFTLAHEYGHAIIAEQGAHVDLRGGRATKEEHFANRFAAEFLMPLPALEEALDHYRLSPPGLTEDQLVMLASFFGVSFAALLGRLEHFSIVSRETGDTLRKSARPVQRIRELGLQDPRGPFPPLPTTYRHMAFTAFHRKSISRSRLAELLQVDVEEAEGGYQAWLAGAMRLQEGPGEGGCAAT